MLTVDVCEQTIPRTDERQDIASGIRQAFEATPQRGDWAVRVRGDNGGDSDSYLVDFYRNGSSDSCGGLRLSISDLHTRRAGPEPSREKFVAEMRKSTDLWLGAHGTPVRRRRVKAGR